MVAFYCLLTFVSDLSECMKLAKCTPEELLIKLLCLAEGDIILLGIFPRFYLELPQLYYWYNKTATYFLANVVGCYVKNSIGCSNNTLFCCFCQFNLPAWVPLDNWALSEVVNGSSYIHVGNYYFANSTCMCIKIINPLREKFWLKILWILILILISFKPTPRCTLHCSNHRLRVCAAGLISLDVWLVSVGLCIHMYVTPKNCLFGAASLENFLLVSVFYYFLTEFKLRQP